LSADTEYNCVVQLPSALMIKNISEVHSEISLRMAEGSDLTLDIPSDAEVDLSFVQLVEAARMDARAAGKTLHLAQPATGSVLKVLKRGGFIDSQSAEDAAFWLHSEVQV